tara:strand:- start:326 stop:1021 length:696 start_codon:yes stop_codon:yes gene_type:complete
MQNDIDNVLDTAYCKRVTHDGQLHRWKSWDVNTPFAPIFDVPIWLDDISEDLIPDIVYAIEENNLGMYRKIWKDYNIFNWEYPVFSSLKECVWDVYCKYMDALELPREDKDRLWIKGWAVVLEPGEGIEQHCHSYHENTYLSCNIAFCNDTVTKYLIPHLSSYYGPWKGQNLPGRLTMFPSWLEHYVDPVNERRYSMGIDIFSKETIDYINNNRIEGDKDQEQILMSIPFA